MQYIRLDIKRFYNNRLIQVMLLLLLVVMIASPISVYYTNMKWDKFAEVIGIHPFQYWLLMDSVGWGHSIYHAFFWVFPVISTGLIYFSEKDSSVYELLVIRGDKKTYYFSKALVQFITTFMNFVILLSINVTVTYMLYSTDAPLTEQYRYFVPKEGMFCTPFYNIDPIYMIFLYVLLNALTIALLSVLILGIQEIFVFKNRYMAVLIPFLGIFVSYYITSLLLNEHTNYDLGIILQPRATSAMTTIISGKDVGLVFGVLTLLDVAILLVGYIRNREVC